MTTSINEQIREGLMECRRFHRLLMQVDLKYLSKSGKKTGNSTTRNISIGGICVTTYGKPLKKTKIYLLEFSLPGQEKMILAEGRVVWNRKYIDNGSVFYDNGIEFMDIKDDYKNMIEEYSIGSVEAD
jgi:hypothetical protein